MSIQEDAKKAAEFARSQTEKSFEEQGFTANKYALKVIEGTEANKIYLDDDTKLPDHAIRLRFLQEYAKVTDLYPAARHEHKHDIKTMPDEEIDRRLAELEAKRKGESPEEEQK